MTKLVGKMAIVMMGVIVMKIIDVGERVRGQMVIIVSIHVSV